MVGYTELVAAANSEIWAIRQQTFQMLMLEARAGEPVKRTRLPKVEGSIAVIPIHGMITQRGSVWDDMFGGTSTMKFEAAFSRAYNSERVGAVVLDVDSPGGTTPGVQLAADRIFSTRGGKPVVAVVNSMADSAAYWMASAAEHFVAVPGAWSIGNIGVYRMHEDVSEALAKDGIKVEFISRPEYKVEGNPYQPLSAEARAFQQQQVDAVYDQFNKSVAKHRGVTPAHARENFGKGRDFNAEQASEMGMVDRVASMSKVFAELNGAIRQTRGTHAEVAALEQELCEAWESGIVEPLVYRPRTTGETARLRAKLQVKKLVW